MNDTDKGLYKITNRESLILLLTKRRKRFRKFVVDIETLQESKSKRFENDLNKYHGSCGCTTGNYFLSIAIVLSAIVIYIWRMPILNWKIITPVILIYVLVGIAGKLTGKLVDAHKFKKTVKDLFQELDY